MFFLNLPNISKFYVLKIINDDEFFKKNLVICPIEWFKKIKTRVLVSFPKPPFKTHDDIDFYKNMAKERVNIISKFV